MSKQWLNSRGLAERIIVTGMLTLQTPAHFGRGDGDGLLDMPLHLDPREGRALLAGTSLTGALRGYVQQGFTDSGITKRLFGYVDADMETEPNRRQGRSVESFLIVDDALGPNPLVELRDGVVIDPKTRTAEDKKKFDMELLTAGTTFPLSFELMVPDQSSQSQQELIEAFAFALQGLENGDISLGKRKGRGFGRCTAGDWQIQRFDMTTTTGMLAWLKYDPDITQDNAIEAKSSASISELLEVKPKPFRPAICTITATCCVDGSLLIRSAPSNGKGPNVVHLQSTRRGKPTSVLSGTSIAGALRARTIRVGNTLSNDNDPENKANGYGLADSLFGRRPESMNEQGEKLVHSELTASRIWVEETEIEKPLSLVQTRVKIDRFTGGSYPGALFSEQPAFGKLDTRATIRYSLRRNGNHGSQTPQQQETKQKEEIGLLLLLLKDLWTGDLPLGGESSIGRGRLQGEEAIIEIDDRQWKIQAGEDGKLNFIEGDPNELESCVETFAAKYESIGRGA